MAANTIQMTKAGTEIITDGMKNLKSTAITPNNIIPLAVVVAVGSIIMIHDFISHGYSADIEKDDGKIKASFKPREYYAKAV